MRATLLAALACTGCGSGPGDGTSGGPYPADVAAPALPGQFVEIPGALPFQYPPPDPLGMMDPPSTGGLIADLDGDGRPEVILTQYPPSGGGLSVSYKYDGVKLTPGPMLPVTDALTAALDLDGDGILDLVYSSSIEWGMGGGKYVRSGLLAGVYNVGALWDIDGNGLTDLIATAYCAPPHVLLQTMPRQFADGASLVAPGGMITANAQFAGAFDGQMLLGTIGFGCGDVQADVPNFYARPAGAGDSRNLFKTVDLVPGLSFSKGAAMGATTGADLDGDGLFDLVVNLSPQHVFISAGKEVKESFFNVMSDKGQPMIPWTSLFLDLDLDGRQDVFYTHGADNAVSNRVMGIGKERSTGHWNSGHGFGRFKTLGDLDRPGDWRVLGVGDLDGDGDADLILGGFGEDPHVYRNDTRGNAVALRLLNKQGSPAWGAELKLTAGGSTQVFQISGTATQHMVNEPLVFAGLGAAQDATVDVTWPGGTTQHESVKAGQLSVIAEKR